MENLNLDKFKLIQPSRIKRRIGKRVMYDLTIKENKSYFIYLNKYTKVLTHNCDGHHISSLLINLFYRWFPYIIKNGNLLKIVTPLVACDYKGKRKYFYTLEEFEQFNNNNNLTNINYLKGLGSLSIEDWIFVMKDKKMFQIIKDRSSNKYLDVVFGDSSNKRKKWLEEGI